MPARRKHKDFTVRGVTYATVAEAADALGVTTGAVYTALRTGTLAGLGLRQSHPRPLPVRVRGVVYPHARAAAEALGLTPSAVHNAISQGRADRVGLPPVCANPACAKPFALAGTTWPSRAQASVALGFERAFISRALTRKWERALRRIVAAVVAHKATAGRSEGGRR